ncbi:MAG TPA: hypothetical protein VGF55_10400 [Gemmataceae bacterium]|jgi:hypothetical protein
MTARRTLLRVEELGGRVLPSATAAAAPPVAAAAAVSTPAQVTTGSAWAGEGRYAVTTNRTTAAKTYTLEASAGLGSNGFFTVSGSVTTVGNKAGRATGRVVLSSPRGTLTLDVTGSAQAANAALPAAVTYTVVSGTGVFSRYAGQGTLKLAAVPFPGYTDRGHVTVSATAPVAPRPTAQSPPPVPTTTGPSWTGQGRYTLATNRTTGARTFTLEGSAYFGNSGYFAMTGTVTTVGNVASGQATGRITLTDPRGTLVLALTGPTQTRNAWLPGTFTYRVVSGTGFFAHYAGQGTFQISAPLFPGVPDRGHFDVAVRPTGK